jgi:hypothetical protein
VLRAVEATAGGSGGGAAAASGVNGAVGGLVLGPGGVLMSSSFAAAPSNPNAGPTSHWQKMMNLLMQLRKVRPGLPVLLQCMMCFLSSARQAECGGRNM